MRARWARVVVSGKLQARGQNMAFSAGYLKNQRYCAIAGKARKKQVKRKMGAIGIKVNIMTLILSFR